MSVKKIMVLCGGKYAMPALQKLAFEGYLCAVGIGKGEKSIVKALEDASVSSKIPFKAFKDKKAVSALKEWIETVAPDYIFSISFPFLIQADVLEYGVARFINFHPGPLPNYRGPMPIFEVLRYREKNTAISVHYMNQDFDEGDILFKDSLAIAEDETYGSLAVKLSRKTADVALNVANMLQFATQIPSEPQEEERARYFEFPTADDSVIKWKYVNAFEAAALIRACNPWKDGADCVLNNTMPCKIISAQAVQEPHQIIPGTILSMNFENKIKVACIDNTCLLIEIIRVDAGIYTASQFQKYSANS